ERFGALELLESGLRPLIERGFVLRQVARVAVQDGELPHDARPFLGFEALGETRIEQTRELFHATGASERLFEQARLARVLERRFESRLDELIGSSGVTPSRRDLRERHEGVGTSRTRLVLTRG